MKTLTYVVLLISVILLGQAAHAETIVCTGISLQQRIPHIDPYKTCGTDNTLCVFERGLKIGTAEHNQCLAEYAACMRDVKAQNVEIDRRNKAIEANNSTYLKCKQAFERRKSDEASRANKWKSRADQAQRRNQSMAGRKSESDQLYRKQVDKRMDESKKIWSRSASEAQRREQELRQRQEKERQSSAMERTRSSEQKSPTTKRACGPDPQGPHSACGSPSNPCQWADIVRWNRCMGNPGY